MPAREKPSGRWSRPRVLLAALLTASSVLVIATPAEALPGSRATRWTIGFGSIGPVHTGMTVRQAVAALHSNASTEADSPYCGLFGLTGPSPTGLTGWAPNRGGGLATLSIGSLFGPSRRGLPPVVRTTKGIRLGSSVAQLQAAYPHRLRTTTSYSNQVKVLPGPHGLAIAFELDRGRVVNIATGRAGLLVVSEYCG